MNAVCHQCGRSHDARSMGYRAFVCSCGANLETKRLARVTTVMPCPQCQTLANPGAAMCAHCNGALLTKPCPDCDELAYVGHTACPHCHASFARKPSVLAAATRSRSCPRCQSMLAATQVAGLALENCDDCGGAYLTHNVLEALIHDVQSNVFDRADALANAAPQFVNASRNPSTAYIKCPDCRTIMNRRLFAHGAGVVIDGCRGHGTFFDAGELRKAVDFMKSGGLVKAAEIEQRRLTERAAEVARERERVQAQHASRPRGYPGGPGDDVTGVDVAGMILSFFW